MRGGGDTVKRRFSEVWREIHCYRKDNRHKGETKYFIFHSSTVSRKDRFPVPVTIIPLMRTKVGKFLEFLGKHEPARISSQSSCSFILVLFIFWGAIISTHCAHTLS